MEQKLRQMLINNLIITVFMILFLTTALLVLVRKYLINPIITLVQQMDNTDENGIPLHISTDTGSKETSIIAKTIQSMSNTIKQSQQSLRKEKERFALAIDGSNDGIWDWDIVKNRLYLSARWQELLGYFDHDFEQTYENFSNSIHPCDKAKVQKALDDNLSREKDEYHCEFRMKHKDGGYVWILARAKIKFDASGKPLRMAGSHTDITKQKELEESLETKVQEQIEDIRKKDELIHRQARLAAMGEMIGAIAHQWRQPLNAVSINIQNLDDDYEDGLIDASFIARFIQKNSRIIEFMSKTIDDFRNFFRIDKNKQDFSVKESVQNALFLHEAQLQTQMIAVKIEGEDFMVHGLKNEFEQVVLNLISNSKDAFIQNKIKTPVITINLATPCLSVTDNAGGIAPEHIDKIFDPYFTTKEQGKGTGIGLYMSRMIIQENMNGTIEVASQDSTTQFTLCFSSNTTA